MRLTGLAVRNLRRFGEARWDLRAPDGAPAPVVGIVGPNESGKSTLLEGILLALFERADSTKKEIAGLSRWGCPERPCVVLEFEHGGAAWRLSQDYEARRSELLRLDSGERLTSPAHVRERLGEMLGAPSGEFFRATAAVAQGEIAALAAARGLDAALERAALSGGGMTAAELVGVVEKELREMERGRERPAKNPGLLKRLEEEVKTLEGELAEQRGRIDEARGLEEEIEADERRLAELERELEEKKARLEKLEVAARLSAELASVRQEAKKAHGDLEKGRALLREARAFEEEAERLHGPGRDVLAAALEEARRVEGARAAVHAPALPVLAGVLAAAAVALGIAASRWWLLLLVPAAALAGAWARRLGWARRGPSLEQVLARVGATSLDELERRIEEGDRQLAAAREKKAEFRGLAGADGEEGEKSLRNKAARLDARAGELASRLEREGGGLAPSAEELDRIRQEVEEGEKELAKLKQRLAGNKGRLDQLQRDGVDSGSLLETEEKLAEARRELERALARAEMLEAALALVEEARAGLGGLVWDEVGREAGRLAGEFTLRRYEDLELAAEGGGLSVRVHSDEAGGRVSSGALSVGAQEQLYLACRVALARRVLGEEAPLFLDDPFVNYDDERRGAALALLRRLAGRGQIVIFSAREDIEPFCDCVVRLGGRGAGPGAEGGAS